MTQEIGNLLIDLLEIQLDILEKKHVLSKFKSIVNEHTQAFSQIHENNVKLISQPIEPPTKSQAKLYSTISSKSKDQNTIGDIDEMEDDIESAPWKKSIQVPQIVEQLDGDDDDVQMILDTTDIKTPQSMMVVDAEEGEQNDNQVDVGDEKMVESSANDTPANGSVVSVEDTSPKPETTADSTLKDSLEQEAEQEEEPVAGAFEIDFTF